MLGIAAAAANQADIAHSPDRDVRVQIGTDAKARRVVTELGIAIIDFKIVRPRQYQIIGIDLGIARERPDRNTGCLIALADENAARREMLLAIHDVQYVRGIGENRLAYQVGVVKHRRVV